MLTGQALDHGTLYWYEYGMVWSYPIREGVVEVVSQGSCEGAYRSFFVMAEGYVGTWREFYHYGPRELSVDVAPWYWYERVYPDGEDVVQASFPWWLILLGAAAALVR